MKIYNIILIILFVLSNLFSCVAQQTNNSVLSTGKWFKIKIANSGIYKITYSDIISYGFSNPANISVYGNGGGMLPLLNATFRYDDLIQNSISFEDINTNGTFDEGDYILFYAKGPTSWKYDTISHIFIHTKHLFSDYSYYFLTDSKPVKIISSVSSLPSGNINVTSFDDYAYHEIDSLNLIKSGRIWVGEQFDIVTNYNFNFYFPNIDTSIQAKVRAEVIARSPITSKFSFALNGSSFLISIPPEGFVSSTNPFAKSNIGNFLYTLNSENITINTSYDKPNSSSQGWLNYLLINVRRKLIMNGTQTIFRDINSVGSGNIASFNITNTTSDTRIWDITDPINVKLITPTSNSGGTLIFNMSSDILHNYFAFNGSSFETPIPVGDVPNQNLHSVNNTKMIIVTPECFIQQAQEIAAVHELQDGLTVKVVTTNEIYNEFSSACPDVSSIRDFMRMLYVKANNEVEQPKYLLLFGNGSFDNKSTSVSNTNYILTYQSVNSLDPINSFVSDDFYALLDSSEGNISSNESLDIGIGRLPVGNITEANTAVNKIKKYYSNDTYGVWKNKITFIADDEDAGQHQGQTNELANKIDTAFPEFHINKIYMDAYQQISTQLGDKYPDVNKAIYETAHKGTILFNYLGHGSEIDLAHEKVLSINELEGWSNINSLPLFFSNSSEFSRFDNEDECLGKAGVFNPSGGFIASIGATRLGYSSPLYIFNGYLLDNLFSKDNDGKTLTFGESFKRAKNSFVSSTSIRNVILIGDPALKPALPTYEINTDSIQILCGNFELDTLMAYSTISIYGSVRNDGGYLLNSTSGKVHIHMYDKKTICQTQGNDGSTPIMTYTDEKFSLCKGIAEVVNGRFSVSFTIPADIQYDFGKGRISYYFFNDTCDASGTYNNFIVGGNANCLDFDTIKPSVNIYMNNESFISGDTINANSTFFAKISDDSGINNAGNYPWHEPQIYLDNECFFMSDFFYFTSNTNHNCEIRYPFTNLTQGYHLITFKVFDIQNNYTEKQITFFVDPVNKIEENLFNKSIISFNNPVEENLIFFNGMPENAEFTILDITGNAVKNGQISNNKINVKNLCPGLYILIITNREKHIITRFIKL